MFETLFAQMMASGALEFIAVVLAIVYLLLVMREHIACWYAAFVSTAIFLYIFSDVKLYMESGLQVYYLAMAVYGWSRWRKGGGHSKAGKTLLISRWRLQQHAVALLLILVATASTTILLQTYTDAELPLLDSFTTWGAIVTTFMVARKILENWIYWLVIDAISIYLYVDRELYFTALLFAVYIVIIFFGWATWLRRYRNQPRSA